MFAHCGNPVVSLHRNVVPDPVLFKVASCYHGEVLALTDVQFLWSWWMITLCLFLTSCFCFSSITVSVLCSQNHCFVKLHFANISISFFQSKMFIFNRQYKDFVNIVSNGISFNISLCF